MIVVTCSSCGKSLKVSEAAAGKRGKCPQCGRSVHIPAGPAAGAAEAATVPPSGVGQAGDTLPAAGTPGRAAAAADSSQAELLAFLAPPQGPGELGRLGPYRVLRVLGSGGMGVVFHAEDVQLQRPVALKALLPSLAPSAEARHRFLREARAAAALKDDHVVTIYQVGEDRGVPFLAMEFLQGETLDDRLRREGKLPPAEVLRVGREMAEGLAAAHERGLIHRDVKPANVWLEAPRGRVKILDFGLARAVNSGSQLTQQGAILGTPAYMAPEQAAGTPLDARCDLFSLGCVLYKLCTGEAPFKGSDVISTLVAVATQQPLPPRELNPGVPPPLAELVLRLLAKKPDDRPGSARTVAQALAALEAAPVRPRSPRRAAAVPVAELAPATRTEELPPAPPRRSRRLLVVLGALVLGAGLLGAGAVVALRFLPPHEDMAQPPDPGEGPVFGRVGPAEDSAEGEWVELFNHKDLSGWETFPGEKTKWEVRDGILVSSGPTGDLFTVRDDYENFHFRIKASINLRGNSGQFFRVQFGPSVPKGYEAQINVGHKDPVKTGSLHPHFDPTLPVSVRDRLVTHLPPHKPNEPFTQEVIADGNHIKILVNGMETVNFHDAKNTYTRGRLALQQLDEGTLVQFHKIEVKELPSTRKAPPGGEKTPPNPRPPGRREHLGGGREPPG